MHVSALLASAISLGLLLTIAQPQAHGQERQWYSVSVYHLNSNESAELFDKTFAEAIVPGMKRQGIHPVGVFEPVNLAKDNKEEDNNSAKPTLPKRYVSYPLTSPAQLATITDSLGNDQDFLEKAKTYLNVSKDDAVYSRVETSLLHAFEGMPQLAVSKTDGDDRRLFELRVYESHSEMKGKLKVEMFNKGEIELFKEVGLDAVFFGEAVAGPSLPNLTYMLVYKDEAHRKEVWGNFLSSPTWDEMKSNPRYNGTVSNIISQHMKPLSYSGIQ